MIGKIIIGKSFKNCITYCLKDKQELSLEDINKLSPAEQQLQHKNRAEILEYNKCFGNIKELTEQMNDVKKQSRRIEKPVMHIILRMAPEDRVLSKNELIEIGRKCAEAFGVADHQYLNILHKDTAQQHIHLVINRIGFDGKATSDSNNY